MIKSMTSGIIVIYPNGHPECEFEVECHNEDEETWGGYSLFDPPYAPFRDYRKARYTLVQDRRQEVK